MGNSQSRAGPRNRYGSVDRTSSLTLIGSRLAAVTLTTPGSSHAAATLTTPGSSHAAAAATLTAPGPSHAAATLTDPGPSHAVAASTLTDPGPSHAVAASTLTDPGPSHAATGDLDSDDQTGVEKAETSPGQEDNEKSDERTLPAYIKWLHGGKSVYMKCSFNNWKTIPLTLSHDEFFTIVELPEGTHEYVFCVDGRWMFDDDQAMITNSAGQTRNIIHVKKSDFNVMELLAEGEGKKIETVEYGQIIPSNWLPVDMPPSVPLQMMQIILNDRPAFLQSEPSVLPVPNHIMINHLYTLSLKNNIFNMEGYYVTTRYKKIFTTTIFYR